MHQLYIMIYTCLQPQYIFITCEDCLLTDIGPSVACSAGATDDAEDQNQKEE